jgi:cardiolipin synthase
VPLDQIIASGPPLLEHPNGRLSPARSQAVLRALSEDAKASDVLLRQLAVEEAVTDSQLVLGNKVTLLRDGPATYRAMYQAIRNAKSHINLEVYILEHDEVGRQLAELLIQRQRQGVQVNLIYDSIGSVNTPPEWFARLTEAGGKVVEFNPVNPAKARKQWVVNQRDHRKLLVVDGHTAFAGGINFSSVYSGGFSSHPKRTQPPGQLPWRDTHIKIEGPVVREFQRLFLQTWEKQQGDRLPPMRYLARVEPKGYQVVRAIGSTPDHKISAIHATLLSAIAHAERTVYLTSAYFVPDGELLRHLKAAARRGVDVRLLLPSQTDFWAPLYAGRSHYSDLLAAGIRVYERQEALLHAKTAVIDGVWSTVGSTNLDWRSLRSNDEVNAVILGGHFARQMEAMFEDDLAQSKQVTREAWLRRGVGSRVKELAARLWERWL